MYIPVLNKLFFVLLFFAILFAFSFVQPTIIHAQTCGGSAGSGCGTNGTYTYAACELDGNTGYQYCDSYQRTVSTYSCLQHGAGLNNGCYACIPTDQYCDMLATVGYYLVCDSVNICSIRQETLDGTCSGPFSNPPSTGTMCGQNGNIHYQACSSGCTTYCSTGTVNCTVCSGGSKPTNTCGYTTGSQTCQHNQPQTCINTSFTRSCSPSNYNNCSTNYTCPSGAGFQTPCVTNIYVHVIEDYNHDGVQNSTAGFPSDAGLAGVTVTDNGGNFPTTDGSGNVTFSGKTPGNYNISVTVPAGFRAVNATTQTASLTNTSGNVNITFYLTPLYKITGYVYKDFNHDGAENNGDTRYTNTSLSISDGVDTVSTNTSDGTFTFPQDLESGSYTVQINAVPSGFQGTDTSNVISVGPSDGSTTLGITPLYTIGGLIYNDTAKNQKYDAGADPLYTNGSHIIITGPSNTTADASNGSYVTSQTLLAGNYTVQYDTSTTPLAAGYSFTTPNSWSVVVGDPTGTVYQCSGKSSEGVCGNPNNGSLSNVNFGVTNEQAHNGSVCLNILNDNNGGGTVSDPFPAAPTTCGGVDGSQAIVNNGTCSTGSGIVFSCSGTFDFGLGSSNPSNLSVGGSGQNSECYTGGGLNVIPTSYDFLTTTAQESNITPTNLDNTVNSDLTTSCNVSDCVLPSNLPKGIYQVNGSLTLDASTYTFPAPPDPSTTSQAYIILVNGDLKINGNIYVPRGSVVVFSVSGNIEVGANVGNTLGADAATNPAANTPNLEGVYSADKSFIVDSNGSGTAICNADGTPLDKRLVIVGVVITNANKSGTGSFVDSRDLCKYDTSCSTVTVGDGTNGGDTGLALNYILNLIADGKFLNNKNFNWQELRP